MNIRRIATASTLTAIIGGALLGVAGTANAVPIAVVPTPLRPGVGPAVVHFNPILHPLRPLSVTHRIM